MSGAAAGLPLLIGVLLVAGAGWGLTQPLAKIAVSTGYLPFGLIFWQLVIGTAVLGLITKARGKSLPLSARHLGLYLLIALIGTVLPNSASYRAAIHLPSGVISILLSLVPMFAFPIALLLGTDRFNWPRLAGLLAGLTGVVLITGPEAALPDRAMALFIPLGLIAPLFYGLEGNVVAKWGTMSLGPIQLLFGASAVGMVIALPLALATGQFIVPPASFGAPEWSLIGASLIHAVVYSAYVWLVRQAGSVFAAQVSYFVTGFGVLWAMALLGEGYSGWVWSAMGCMMFGLFLVQPRTAPAIPLAPGACIPEDAQQGR